MTPAVRTYEEQELQTERDHVLHGLEDVRALAEAGTFSPACRRFGDVRLLMDRRLAAEEELLYLLAHACLVAPDEATRIRAGHTTLRRLLDSAWRALGDEDAVAFARVATALAHEVELEQSVKRNLIEVALAHLDLVGAADGTVLLVRRTLD